MGVRRGYRARARRRRAVARAGMSTARSAILTAGLPARRMTACQILRARNPPISRPGKFGKSDDLFTHLCASMLTGLVTTTVTNPVDMIKTQLYVSSPGPNSTKLSGRAAASPGRRGGGGARRAEARGTARVSYGGWTANYLRLGPQTVMARSWRWSSYESSRGWTHCDVNGECVMIGRSPEERRDVRRRDESSRRIVATTFSFSYDHCVFGSRDASRFASEPDSRCVKIQSRKSAVGAARF